MTPSMQLVHPEGFSFVELLIALVAFSVLTGAIFGFFTSQRDAYRTEDMRLERDQSLRTAMETLFRELSGTGFRAVDASFADNLSQWVPSAFIPSEPLPVVFDTNPKITMGEGGLPDVITFACAVPTANNPTTLFQESDGTSISVSLSNTNSERQYKPGDILAIGYLPEHVRVVVVDGNTVTIDADPGASGLQPLQAVYPTGTPVEEISIVSYSVFNDDNDPDCRRHEAGLPVLKRKVNAGGFYPVADNVFRLKVTAPEDGVLEIAISGQLAHTRFEGAGSGEKSMKARMALRNRPTAGFSSGCPKPEAPGGLRLEGGLDGTFPCQIMISWDVVTEDTLGDNLEESGCPVTGYRVFYDTVSGVFGNYVDVSVGDAAGYVLDVSGIAPSEVYVSVAAENSGGIGGKSPETVVADAAPPEKTTGIAASVAGESGVFLSWDENAECDLAGYYLYRKKDAGPLELVSGLIPAGSFEHTDTGLSAGASYRYSIEAVDFGFNAGEMSDAVTVVLP